MSCYKSFFNINVLFYHTWFLTKINNFWFQHRAGQQHISSIQSKYAKLDELIQEGPFFIDVLQKLIRYIFFISLLVVIISPICKVFIELCYNIGVNYYNLLTLMYISLFLLSKQLMFIINKCFIIHCWTDLV